MDWQEALRARLLADSPLATLVSTRIDWLERPQGKPLPAVTLQSISDGREQHMKGFEGLQPKRVQYDVWGDTFASVRAVVEALIGDASQDGAATVSNTANGHRFTRAMVELAPRDLTERVSAGDGQKKTVFRTTFDLIHHHAFFEEVS